MNIYHQPWTTDKQNRFFSLEAWGPVETDPKFTAKFLGRPANIAFKSKHKATGKEEPCLCFLFPSFDITQQPVCRLVQPSNFVTVNAFDGYEPIEESVIKKYKSKKDLSVGTWYKKVWSIYCTAVEPHEYKQPIPTGTVKIATPKKKVTDEKDPTQKSLESAFAKAKDKNSTFSGDEEGDAGKGDAGKGDDGSDTEPFESEPENVDLVALRADVGGKSPRHLNTLKEAEKWCRDRLAKERQADKNLAKEHRVNNANKKKAKVANPEWDSDNDSLPDVSSASEFTDDTDFEEDYTKLARRKYNDWKKTQREAEKKDKAGSSKSGKYELC